jgi:hypothetical protein
MVRVSVSARVCRPRAPDSRLDRARSARGSLRPRHADPPDRIAAWIALAAPAPRGETPRVVPCLVGCLALSFPRLAVLVLFLFSDYLGRAYEGNFWPFLGFLFLPWTTLAYAVAMNENGGQLSGWYVALYVLALLMDFGVVGFGGGRRRRRRKPDDGPGLAAGGGGGAPRSIDVRGERVG